MYSVRVILSSVITITNKRRRVEKERAVSVMLRTLARELARRIRWAIRFSTDCQRDEFIDIETAISLRLNVVNRYKSGCFRSWLSCSGQIFFNASSTIHATDRTVFLNEFNSKKLVPGGLDTFVKIFL